MVDHISELQKLLPNFPIDTLEQWFLPYVESDGMPWDNEGNAIGRWKYLLKNKSLNYWENTIWNQIDIYIPAEKYSETWQSIIRDMIEGAVLGKTNDYSLSISNLKERFYSVLRYLETEKIFPKPPILLLEYNKEISILDGNHRVAAFLYSLSQHYKDQKNELNYALPNLKQKYWIGINRDTNLI